MCSSRKAGRLRSEPIGAKHTRQGRVYCTPYKVHLAAYPASAMAWVCIDVELGQIEVPPEKLALLRITMSQARQSAQIKARTLASIVGRINSMGLAFGPISRFMTRSLYAALESRCTWCEMLTLSSEAREELNFWSSSLGEYNSQPIWHTPSAVVYTDASDTGYGGM